MSDSLLHVYNRSITTGDETIYKVVLDYKGDLSTFPEEIEILSLIDDWLHIGISMPDLPSLASKQEIRSLNLPLSAVG